MQIIQYFLHKNAVLMYKTQKLHNHYFKISRTFNIADAILIKPKSVGWQ